MKTIVISGTTSGLGFALADFYIKKGWDVIGLARRESSFNANNYKHIQIDLTNYDDLYKILVISKLKKIDVLVHNAASFENKSLEQTDFSQIDNILSINLITPIMLTKLLLLNMSQPSRIFFINSVAGINQIEKQSIYCASKHGLTAFAGVLGKELQQRKIKITSIHPGGLNTPLWNDKQPYPGSDVEKTINPNEIVKLIDFINDSDSSIEYKTIKLFPDIEWHQ